MDDSGYGMEQRFRELVEIAGDFAWEIDASTRFIFASPRLVFGWPAENLLGKTIAEFLDDPDQAKLFAATEPATADEIRFRAADGGTILLALAARPVFGPGGVWSGARGICRVSGVQDLTQADQHIRDGLAGHVVRAVRDATQPESALTAALTALGLAIGASGGAILRAGGDPPLRTSITWGAKPPPAGLMMVRNAIQDKEAASVSAPACQLMVHAVHYRHELKGVVLLWRRAEEQPFGGLDRTFLGDVADHLGIVIAQIEARERITTLSRTDPLTTLTNRNAFFDEFARRLLRLDRGTQSAVLLYIEVLNLKLVNDRLGPSAGDEALVTLAGILRDNTRAGDLIARYGGSQFVLWIEGINEQGARRRMLAIENGARRLAALTGSPEQPLGVAVGVAAFDPLRPETPVQLVSRSAADAAGKIKPDKNKPGDAPMPVSLSA